MVVHFFGGESQAPAGFNGDIRYVEDVDAESAELNARFHGRLVASGVLDATMFDPLTRP